MSKYDYIITGAGCAGLSLLMRMIRSGACSDKKILLVDREEKRNNDRTWCFWETGAGFFEDIVYRKWNTLDFISDDSVATMNIEPYSYKMIRGGDFYDYCYHEINRQENIEKVYGEVTDIYCYNGEVTLMLDNRPLHPGKAAVFNSIPLTRHDKDNHIGLLQHFKGWVIETSGPVFNPGKAILMDFRVHQQHGTAFVYILPFSEREALVEYTLFTKEVLKPDQYDQELKQYILQFLGINDYTVKEEEFGVIPMTTKRYDFFRDNIYHIGMQGGQTKASTGYTFQFIQKQSRQIVDGLLHQKDRLILPPVPRRFRFYDNTFLHILYHKKLPGKRIFTDLFRKNKPQQVLKFLDNETSLKEELKILSSLPMWPFLTAAIASRK